MNPEPTVDPRSTHPDTLTRSTVTPAEYAELAGLHIRTVRERIRRGELVAVKVKGRHGPEYRIPYPDSNGGSPVDPAWQLPLIDGDTHGDRPVDPPWAAPVGELVDLLREKDQVIGRLHDERAELFGRLGFYQARV